MIKQRLFLRPIIIAFFISVALFLLNGCGKEEMQRIKAENETLKNETETLKKENETLKTQIASLKQEVSKLKETADYHFQQGVELLKDNKYEEAKAEFATVIEKYPESPLISSAKGNMKKISHEIKRIETEKLTAEENTPADAEATWDMLRRNPKEKEGRVFTLELQADFVLEGQCIIESHIAPSKVFSITCLYTKEVEMAILRPKRASFFRICPINSDTCLGPTPLATDMAWVSQVLQECVETRKRRNPRGREKRVKERATEPTSSGTVLP